MFKKKWWTEKVNVNILVNQVIQKWWTKRWTWTESEPSKPLSIKISDKILEWILKNSLLLMTTMKKMIESRITTSTTITNNKRKISNDSLVNIYPPSYLVYLILRMLSQVLDHYKYVQEESPFLICFDLYNFLIHTSTPVLCNKYLCEK